MCHEIVSDLSAGGEIRLPMSLRQGLSRGQQQANRNQQYRCVVLPHDNALTFTRLAFDTFSRRMREPLAMLRVEKTARPLAKYMTHAILFVACAVCVVPRVIGQNTPLISGGVGFVTSTNGGNTTYIPVISPLLAAPVGKHILVESRATLLDSWFPKGGGQTGYKSDSFIGLNYLQGDFIVAPRLTVVAGEFPTPFGTFNERLIPIWIGNFGDAPLIYSLGLMGTGAGVGGMVRGSLASSSRASFDYAAYYSATSTNEQFNAERSSGGKASIFLPPAGLEVGASYGRLLQGTHANYIGTHLWWTPIDAHFRLRSEYAHGPHAQGYWAEADYRLARFGGEESFVGRMEPVFRVQQTFRNQTDFSDGLPSADTKRVDFGFDYRLPHEVRINTSYSRQFSSTGNRNVWLTGIVYRFMFPTWKGK